MLNSEQAQEELKKIKNDQWTVARIAAADGLEPAMRETARSILGLDKPANAPKGTVGAQRIKVFLAMDTQARLQFFETMAPGRGEAIERGWQLLDRLPYQTSLARKPFRAPKHPAVLIGRRINWMVKLLRIIGPYQQNVAWFAAWAPHVAQFGLADTLGIYFAAAIDAGGSEGEEIFQILCASGRNEHEISGMGRHVTRGLLSASRADGWEFVEKMLLAAQREEGLRQVILETCDEAHPQAFRRMLKLILDNNLERFSATVRAFDTWLAYQWGAPAGKVVTETISKILLCLEDAAAREAALKSNEAEQVYLGLWCQAFDDAAATVAPATELLKHPQAEHRYVAAHLLDQLGLKGAQKSLMEALGDGDLRVAARAADVFRAGEASKLKDADLFERIEKLIARCPDRPEKLKAAVWPWAVHEISKESIADILPPNLGSRPATRLIPHLQHMGIRARCTVIGVLAEQGTWDAETRKTLFALVGDPSGSVRESAIQHLQKCEVTAEEAVGIERLLDRKTGDLRRAVLVLLSRQNDAGILTSADRLLAATSQPQRVGGLELLRQSVEGKRCVGEARERAKRYAEAHPKLNEGEAQQIKVILAEERETPVLANALGLISHEDRTWAPAPVARGVQFHSPVTRRIVSALNDLFEAHATEVVTFVDYLGESKKVLFSEASLRPVDPKLPMDEARARLPLASLWENWWNHRGPEFRDADGMELLRALAWYEFVHGSFRGPGHMLEKFPDVAEAVFGEVLKEEVACAYQVRVVLNWFLRIDPPAGGAEFCLDAAESALALVPKELLQFTGEEAAKLAGVSGDGYVFTHQRMQEYQKVEEELWSKKHWRSQHSPFDMWLIAARTFINISPKFWPGNLRARFWKLLRWVDEPVRPQEAGGASGGSSERCLPRKRAAFNEICDAHCEEGSTDADIIEDLMGARFKRSQYEHGAFQNLAKLTRRKPSPELGRYDFLGALVEKCRRRILEVELTRGDSATAASRAALQLKSVWGVSNLIAILKVLGKRNFSRGWARGNESLETVISHLARVCFPSEGETAGDFGRQVKEAGITEQRLVELAVYAPQWAEFVEASLGWSGFTEAVWWVHAHTKGHDWSVDAEIRELWQADMHSRTSLSSEDLLEGGVDVVWFHRTFEQLGAKRWEAICEAAKFSSSGSGHARAMLFAQAMLGGVTKMELVERIMEKRHQDSVRSLGLLPLAGGKKREADLLDRYKVIQEFRRGSKQFGSMRQASEKRAAQIGQHNLARAAGFADPIRLEWAMEAKAVEDLSEGPIEVSVEGLKVSLGIDPWGEIELTVAKDGKTLADIPAKLKKNPKIAALRTRKVELKRQASRIRPSLEQFMVRGDELRGQELQDLMAHPLLSPMLKNLVVIGEGISGYPAHEGKALENYSGQVEAVKADEKLRIAHPHDLLPAKQWSLWQKDCLARERIQPFKQVFRELYPLTETERNEGKETSRYAGHQVQPRQALALLGGRGWLHHPEEGVRKVYHEAGFVAWLSFEEGFFTPAEVEGLTLENVHFTRRNDPKPVELRDLPPRLFSEAMRDLDLVVSVAHSGGVDPEASASTIEMRATLVKETASLLKLTNVELKDRYALIKGQFGEYSVHLGSAMTRKMPGETLFIVAVHGQHRGRLFLPFADDDPRTAEVMSKVLLLARDKEIKDPTILDQIR